MDPSRKITLNVRLPEKLNQLLKQAQGHNKSPKDKSKIVRHAIRRCLPDPSDSFIDPGVGGKPKVVIFSLDPEDKVKLARIAAVRASDDVGSQSLSAVLVECIRRHLFWHAEDWNLPSADVKAATGYTSRNLPPGVRSQVVELFLPSQLHPPLKPLVDAYIERVDAPNTLQELLRRVETPGELPTREEEAALKAEVEALLKRDL